MQVRVLLAVIAAGIALAGCSGSIPVASPEDPVPAIPGRTEPVSLLTHCGVRTANVDGREWKAVNPAPEPLSTPNPDGAGSYDGYTDGTATWIATDRWRFDAPGLTAPVTFVPAATSPPPCA